MRIQQRYTTLLFAFIALLVSASFYTDAYSAEIAVEEISIATAIIDKAPEGVNTEFSGEVGKLFCFTRITGAKTPTTIFHVWYYGGSKMAEVSLAVNSNSYRTYSSKNFIPQWTGEWKVEILSETGDLLTSTSFVIK